MAIWLNGKISINCQDVNVIHYRHLDVSDLIDKVIIHKCKILNATLCFRLRMVKL
jgi:hypothetical protein